ncbi:MAG TPA: hypothetical protein VIV11_04835 [Kofleriaceae bacterium]
MIEWLFAFAVTCAIELAVVFWLGPRHPRRLAVGLVAQLVTHPFVWLAMASLPGSQLARLLCVELWATLVETAVYKRFLGLRGRDAFALSALANAASLLLCAAIALVFF